MSWIALANITLTSAAASVTFGSIPTSVNGTALRDLILVVEASKSSGATNDFRVTFNSSSSGYTQVYAYGNGSTTVSGAGSDAYMALGRASTSRSVNIWQIMDYSATDKHKTALDRSGLASADLLMRACRWANTSAITTIVVAADTNLTSGSTFALYGIAG